jgi:hypothetical protein
MSRVIQWATGVTGMMSLRHLIGRADFELVGVRVYDPARSGVDAGTLCGMNEVGVTATDDREKLIDADADVVLYMGKVETDTEGCFADVCDLLASGKNVVATGSRFIHPRSLHEGLAHAVESAARARQRERHDVIDEAGVDAIHEQAGSTGQSGLLDGEIELFRYYAVRRRDRLRVRASPQ